MITQEEIVINTLISEIINICLDESKLAIKKSIDEKSDKNKSLSSQMYQVIINALNRITYNNLMDDQEKIYDAAEVLLKSFKSDQVNLNGNIKPCLKKLGIAENKYDEFKEFLSQEICKDTNTELYKRINLILEQQGINNIINTIEQSVNKINQVVSATMESNESDFIVQETKFQNNKKQLYLENWKDTLFLHKNINEKSLTLEDAFIMPDYKNLKKGFWEEEELGDIIKSFVNLNGTSTMLITGMPGTGKSSITSWIANEYATDDRIIILRFRDWQSDDLEEGLLNGVRSTYACKNIDLEDKILILDGFDEMKALPRRKELLSEFLNDIRDFDNFKCIILSRPNYINDKGFNMHFSLLPFDPGKIANFYETITGNELKEEIDDDNIDVYGVPVILYMAIMSNIDITKHATKPELYNRIFAETGGIFDRFASDNEAGYSNGSHIMSKSHNKKYYLKFLRNISFQMFEEGDPQLFLDDCIIPPMEDHGKKVSILEFPIKYLFETTKPTIEFIHLSIYEYFASEYIFMALSGAADESKERLADTLGRLFSSNKLSNEILEFLRFKVRSSKLNAVYEIIHDTFQLMMQDGMTYYMIDKCKNVIQCEMNIFINMIELLNLWENRYLKFDKSARMYFIFYIWKLNMDDKLLTVNLSGVDLTNVNLRNIVLKKVNLSGANLLGVDLRKADLDRADLTDAILTGANLSGTNLHMADLGNTKLLAAKFINADLSGANLVGANLITANFHGADLTDAIFDEKQSEILCDQIDLTKAKVYLEESKEVIDYEFYYYRKSEIV